MALSINGRAAPFGVLAASALCDKRNSLAGAERYCGGDAPTVVDGLAPRFIVAVGCIPGSLLASFPSLAHVIRIGFEEALRFQHLQPAVDFNPIMTRAAVEPPAGACIDAA